MDTRCCRHLHFIAAIKSGSVTKLRNVSSCGKPALRSKGLKDVCESADADRISSDTAVEDDKVLPLADRTLWKENFGCFEFVNNAYNDADDDADDNDMSDESSMTLSQLKERKKQKLSHGTHSNANQEYDSFQFEDDEFDLKEPLTHWKHKLLKKKSKRKRKCSSERAIRLELALSGTSEPIDGSENFAYANRDSMSLVCVNTEDIEDMSFEFPSPIAFIDVDEPEYDSEIPYEFLEGHAYKNQELVLYGDRYQEYFPGSPENIEIDQSDGLPQVLCIEEYRNCALNEVCYDHLEPNPLLEVSASDIVYVSKEMMSYQPHVVSSMPDSETNDKSDNIFSGSSREFVVPRKDYSHALTKTSGQSSCSSGVQALDTAVNSKIEIVDSLPPMTQSKPFSLQLYVSSLDSHACSILDDESVSTNDGTVERNQSRACSPAVASKDCWSPRDHLPPILATTSEKQPPETVSVDSECGSSSGDATFHDDYALSALVQKPGRFTQKIIPPTSQERLCMALNCEELHSDVDEYKCKEKLSLEEHNKNRSIARSNIETARGVGNIVQLGQLNRRKVVKSPSQLLQKANNEKRGSPPKFHEQSCYSRSLPNINSGCTSITSCSKGAAAFAQLQMHDINSLTRKLLNELKSMKDIIEQKLLLNPCRNLTLRNDADEVVEAIKTAMRVEQNAKRWLSAMARDCHRYCKIMSLTRDGPSPLENDIHREKRKIVFADEAGEMLCHVKFFENDSSSLSSLTPKQDSPNC